VKNLAEDRLYVVEVIESDYPIETADANRQIYLDLTDTEFLPLPPGVGVQTLNNKPPTGVDNYLGFNNNTVALRAAGGTGGNFTLQWAYGGVILFNGQGQLVSRTYGFRTGFAPPNGQGNDIQTSLDRLIVMLGDRAQHPGEAGSDPVESALGFVLYDREGFRNNGNDGDPQLTSSLTPAAEVAEEEWINNNALFLMVNRYNGTLTRAN
jgi:hypothetical protein